MVLRISPKFLAQLLALIVLLQTLINITIQFSRYFLDVNIDSEPFLTIAHAFIFEGNGTVPKWYASSSLLLCTLLLGTIAWGKLKDRSRYGPHWAALTVIFCAISLEEAVGFHEWAGEVVKTLVHATGFLYHAWTILGVIFIFVITLTYLKFVFYLPRQTRRLFLVAAIFYLGGAVGMEIIRGPYNEAHGIRNMTAAMLKTFEEFCQMTGIVVFIYALLSYISTHIKEVHLYIGDEAPAE